jgi:hypothetical protein
MKKIILLALFFVSSLLFSQKNNFVKSNNSTHKVVMTEFLKSMTFNGKKYEINERRGVFKYRKDTIVWVYGQDPNHWGIKPILIGFYNDFKNYVVDTKTESTHSSKIKWY